MRIYDISQPLRVGLPVWPGDQPFAPRWSARKGEGSSVNVGAVSMSLHTGTHADAPLHVLDGGAAIDMLPLEAYVGPAIVVEWLTSEAIPPEAIAGLDLTRSPRVLFKTRLEGPPAEWTDRFAVLSTALVEALAEAGAILVGIDTPSVDEARSTELPCHYALYERGLVNLENLDLTTVPAGRYDLVALPLALEGWDASPVRAILIDRADPF